MGPVYWYAPHNLVRSIGGPHVGFPLETMAANYDPRLGQSGPRRGRCETPGPGSSRYLKYMESYDTAWRAWIKKNLLTNLERGGGE